MSKKKLLIALAGNANVGKSVIFNYLTGLHQHIGNWPGKTVAFHLFFGRVGLKKIHSS
jgi:Fe2+ transport system protein B